MRQGHSVTNVIKNLLCLYFYKQQEMWHFTLMLVQLQSAQVLGLLMPNDQKLEVNIWRAHIPSKANDTYSPFLPIILLLPSPSFPFSLFPLEVGPLNPARGLEKRVQAEPGSQTIITGFWAENCLPVRAILRAHSQKNMFVISLFTSNITWGGTH